MNYFIPAIWLLISWLIFTIFSSVDMYKSATLPLLEPETKRWLLYSLFDATDYKYSKASSNIVGSISDCLNITTAPYN